MKVKSIYPLLILFALWHSALAQYRGGQGDGFDEEEITWHLLDGTCMGQTPTVDLGADTSLCKGDSLLLDAAFPMATYLWSDGSTGSTFLVNETGYYEVAVSMGGGNCKARDTIWIAFDPVFDLGPDSLICQGDQFSLDPGISGGTYAWNTGENTQVILADTPGTYFLTMIDLQGCTGSDTVVLNMVAPTIPDLGPDVQLCAGDSVWITPGVPALSYLWSTNDTTAGIFADLSGNYVLELVDSNGCSGTDSLFLDVTPLPVPTLFITGDSLYAQGFVSYQWLKDGNPVPGANDSIYWVQTSGIYSLEATDTFGCSGVSDTLQVLVVSRQEAFGPAALAVFPNPVENILTIRFTKHAKSELNCSLINPLGLTVSQFRLGRHRPEIKLDISLLLPGIYGLLAIEGENRLIQKILIK